MGSYEDLRAMVDALTTSYNAARSQLQEKIDKGILNCTIEEVLDSTGRFMLLDALTVLVSAQASLVQYEASNSKSVDMTRPTHPTYVLCPRCRNDTVLYKDSAGYQRVGPHKGLASDLGLCPSSYQRLDGKLF